MLADDPPPGTMVKFVRDVRLAKAYERAKLLRPMARYIEERGTDVFEVEYRGQRMTVQRQDIELA